ncbi:MAG: hypothetical protein ACW97A_10890 [Candidatus Thorarchaeota archaeon]|jgi:hypothetical protein
MMQIIAQRSGTDDAYLVDLGSDGKGVVVETVGTKLVVHEPFNVQSILARGYWNEPDKSLKSRESKIIDAVKASLSDSST